MNNRLWRRLSICHQTSQTCANYWWTSSATAEIDDGPHCHETSVLLFFKIIWRPSDRSTDITLYKYASCCLKRTFSVIRLHKKVHIVWGPVWKIEISVMNLENFYAVSPLCLKGLLQIPTSSAIFSCDSSSMMNNVSTSVGQSVCIFDEISYISLSGISGIWVVFSMK